MALLRGQIVKRTVFTSGTQVERLNGMFQVYLERRGTASSQSGDSDIEGKNGNRRKRAFRYYSNLANNNQAYQYAPTLQLSSRYVQVLPLFNLFMN